MIVNRSHYGRRIILLYIQAWARPSGQTSAWQSTMHIPRSGLWKAGTGSCMRSRYLTFPNRTLRRGRTTYTLVYCYSSLIGEPSRSELPSHTWAHPFPFIFWYRLLTTRRVRFTLPLMDHVSFFCLREIVPSSCHSRSWE